MSDEKIDVLAVMADEVVTMRRLEAWVNEALAPTSMDADEAVARMEAARDAVAELIRLAANAERIIRNCVNADQLPEGYMHHADGLRDALSRVRSS